MYIIKLRTQKEEDDDPMKARVVKEFHFDAAHYLPNYSGPCRNLHGHSFRVQVQIVGAVPLSRPDNPDIREGMVIDFRELTSIWKNYIEHHLDHRCLNEVDLLQNLVFVSGTAPAPPTAEVLSRVLFHLFALEINTDLRQVEWVRVWESATAYAEVRKEDLE